MTLTAMAVRHAKPRTKPRKLYDSRGLYLEVSPTGRKWWRFKYRFMGKEKRISLGVYPDVSLSNARLKLQDARTLLANNVDPSEARKAAKAVKSEQAANSFEAVAREWFATKSQVWAESHSSKVLGRLEKYIFPCLGATQISKIDAPQLLTSIRRIEQRGVIETAHRTLQHCSQVFRYAVATGRAERDPAADLRGALTPFKRKHFAAITEPDQLSGFLRQLDGYKGTLTVECALRLAPHVFVRPGELRQAKWSDIDLDAGEWRFAVTKTETQHIVPLSHQAGEILRELQPLTGHGKYVFPSARHPKGNRAMSDNAILAAMRKMGISKDEMSGHGFRAMARTMLDEVLGYRVDFIEHQLAHAVKDPNGRAYNRTAFLPERRDMMQAWSNYLDALKSGPDVATQFLESEIRK